MFGECRSAFDSTRNSVIREGYDGFPLVPAILEPKTLSLFLTTKSRNQFRWTSASIYFPCVLILKSTQTFFKRRTAVDGVEGPGAHCGVTWTENRETYLGVEQCGSTEPDEPPGFGKKSSKPVTLQRNIVLLCWWCPETGVVAPNDWIHNIIYEWFNASEKKNPQSQWHLFWNGQREKNQSRNHPMGGGMQAKASKIIVLFFVCFVSN